MTARAIGRLGLVGLALAFTVLYIRDLSAAEQATALRGMSLYRDPNSPARRQADAWQRLRPADAALLRRIADQPSAVWLGAWSGDIRGTVDGIVSRASSARAVPVLVAYNIPYRDCGLHSRGGAGGGDVHRAPKSQRADSAGSSSSRSRKGSCRPAESRMATGVSGPLRSQVSP